jgi:hypothetical protein
MAETLNPQDRCIVVRRARAIAQGWFWRHESGTYVKFTDSGAALFA